MRAKMKLLASDVTLGLAFTILILMATLAAAQSGTGQLIANNTPGAIRQAQDLGCRGHLRRCQLFWRAPRTVSGRHRRH